MSADSYTPRPSETADYRHDLATAGYLDRLEKVAGTFPREGLETPDKVDPSDISLPSLKIKEKPNENIIDDLEDQIFTRLDK